MITSILPELASMLLDIALSTTLLREILFRFSNPEHVSARLVAGKWT
jgi:hypothetical protein